MNRPELMRLVETICHEGEELEEEELDSLVTQFSEAISHPGGSDLIYYPSNWGLPNDPSPAEIVDAAMSWRPQTIRAVVLTRRVHPRRSDLYCYEVEVPGLFRTQVVSSMLFDPPETCIIALSGVQLANGETIRHKFVEGAFSVGKALGRAGLE